MKASRSVTGFEHDGVWWDPQNADERWVGTLRFDERDGATLTVVGPATDGNPFQPMDIHDVILGVSADGIGITLISCYERSRSGAFGPAPRRTEIFANHVITSLLGGTPAGQHDRRFVASSFSTRS